MEKNRPTPPTLVTLGLLGILAVTACSGEADRSEALEGTPGESAEGQTLHYDVPDAIMGTAPAPRGEELRYVDGEDATVGYVAVPEGTGPFPAVILIHEWNGLVDRVREVADALADEGYVALAADLYQGQVGSNRDENVALMSSAREDMGRVISNLDAAAAYLRARSDVTGKVGAMGWCFGGGIALSYGLGGEQHDATAIFYGALLDDPAELAALDHEVYGTFGALDSGPSPESVNAFAAALDAAGIENDLHIYDAVNHGFWLRAGEDADVRGPAAQDAWSRLKAYLDRTLRSE